MRLQLFQGLGHLEPGYHRNYSPEPCSQTHRHFNAFKALEMFIMCLMQEWNYAHPYTARCVCANILHTERPIPGLVLTLTVLNSVICKTGRVQHWSEKQQCSQTNHSYIASEISLEIASAKKYSIIAVNTYQCAILYPFQSTLQALTN